MDEKKPKNFFEKFEWSTVLTVFGIILLFSSAIAVTLVAPSIIDPSWNQASSNYQLQIYQNIDPNVYIAKADPMGQTLQYIYHLQDQKSLLAFIEHETMRIIAPNELEKYVTHYQDKETKISKKLLLLRQPKNSSFFDGETKERQLRVQLQEEWKKKFGAEKTLPYFQILELYEPNKQEAFAITNTDGVIENWIEEDFQLVDFLNDDNQGYIYILNPIEFRTSVGNYQGISFWKYDENGKPIQNLDELKSSKFGFLSRKELILLGENIYKIEGCWYCHTDQTRTLIQDTVVNGSASYPAPPSSANEYIFQKVSFPGTRRIGPDLSREGIKKPSRDWHRSHFWSPKTESPGTIMPAFRHFFDNDPRGTSKNPTGVPNYRFEAVFQYLMTKGTRITAPNQAWWKGLDPINTIEIIEGRRK